MLALAGYLLGSGVSKAGTVLGDSIVTASKNVGSDVRYAADSVGTKAAEGMINSSKILAEAGLKATDLATKQIVLAMLQSVAELGDRADQIVSKFGEGNLLAITHFTQELDRISRDRMADIHSELKNALDILKNESAEWRNTAQQLQGTIITASLGHAALIGFSVLISAVVHALLTNDSAPAKFSAFSQYFGQLLLGAVPVFLTFKVFKYMYGGFARAKADADLQSLQMMMISAQLTTVQARVESLEQELRRIM